MNRIILIGNGFDLAHGLKTSYADFIYWYWNEWNLCLKRSFNSDEEDELCSFKLKDGLRSMGWFNTWVYRLQLPLSLDRDIDVLTIAKQNRELCDFTIKSPFFKKICEEVERKNWVDIENVYYEFLKKSDNPKQLNEDLEFLKNKLVEYLSSLSESTLNPNIRNQIMEPVDKEDIAISSKEKWEEMLQIRIKYELQDWDKLIEGYEDDVSCSNNDVQYFKKELKKEIFSDNKNVEVKVQSRVRLANNIMLLNFNYTNIAEMYLPNFDKFFVNNIHGMLSKPESVIFGYGDERDDEYKVLMKKNENEYLQHIKSFQYLDTSNYRKMLAFIESDSYQICIMGHSCGVSDRTLLATLFEHPNCVSIKPYYYKKEDGTDNYRELVQNIARNFSSPALMRDRVVRKEQCVPLGYSSLSTHQ